MNLISDISDTGGSEPYDISDTGGSEPYDISYISYWRK